jgi:hypothetical protein
MGNGVPAYDYSAARFGSIGQLNGPDPQVTTRAIGGIYPVQQLSNRTFRYGGPGVC